MKPVEPSSYERLFRLFGISAGSEVVVPTLPAQQKEKEKVHPLSSAIEKAVPTGYDEFFGGSVNKQTNKTFRLKAPRNSPLEVQRTLYSTSV